MNIHKNYLFFLVLVLFSSSYSQEWHFHPDSLKDDGPNVPMIINPLVEGYTPVIDYSIHTKSGEKTNGFRVQVLSTNSIQKAENARKDLSGKIGYNVRVIFEAPNYKVRAGGFTNLYDADRLRKYIQSLGYRQAWVVRAHITN